MKDNFKNLKPEKGWSLDNDFKNYFELGSVPKARVSRWGIGGTVSDAVIDFAAGAYTRVRHLAAKLRQEGSKQ